MNWMELYPFIAHRGLHSSNVAENSMASFELAIKRGYAIELDIQFLRNGEPIVFHDNNLFRMTGEDCEIKDINPQFLRFLRYRDGQKILTMGEVLAFVDSRVPLLIEIKNDTYTKSAMSNVINLLKSYRGKFSLQSFNPQVLRHIKSKAPHFSIGQLTTVWNKTDLNFWQRNFLRHAEFYNELDFISVDQNKLGKKEIFLSKQKKIPLLSWTIRSQQELRKVRSKCSGFIFEGFLP